ncbi:MAG TPA: hypothetical protein VMP41_02665 [Acidimicrobiales bacterium]|nr:hypothetical protein [Acidimicrobiales bacterium]
MPGEARPGPGVFTRWRAWLQGRATDRTADEWEDKTTPATRGERDTQAPAPSLDDVLRDAVQRRDPGDDRGAGSAAS